VVAEAPGADQTGIGYTYADGSQLNDARVIACPDCAAVQIITDIRSGRVQCWRCAGTLDRATGRSLDAALACSLTTLVFLFPASLLPLLEFSYAGFVGDTRVASGVAVLWREGWVLVAIIIALQVIIFPFFRFGLLAVSLGAIRAGFDATWIGPCFR